MRPLTALPLLLIFLTTGCYTYYSAPGAVGKVLDADTGAPVRGARITRLPRWRPFIPDIPGATAVADKAGEFNLSPRSHTDCFLLAATNPPAISGIFVVSADGYATNELRSTASSRTFWRAQLGRILLKRP